MTNARQALPRPEHTELLVNIAINTSIYDNTKYSVPWCLDSRKYVFLILAGAGRRPLARLARFRLIRPSDRIELAKVLNDNIVLLFTELSAPSCLLRRIRIHRTLWHRDGAQKIIRNKA
jgi:hypothetical protein